jgi:hypothetical protein
MRKKDDASKVGSGRGRNPAGTAGSALDADALLPSLSQYPLVLAIEAERAQLLQAYALLTCLYETLLYADTENAVLHADVAHVAARLIDESVARLDLVRLAPMIEGLRQASAPTTNAAGAGPSEGRPATGRSSNDKVEDRSQTFRSYKVEDAAQVH